MSEKKRHIDELFRKDLSDLELSPPPELWNKISSDLAARKRSILFYTVRIAATGLILLGLGGGLIYWFTQDNWDNYLSPTTTVTRPVDEQGPVPVPPHARLNSGEDDHVSAGTESETYENEIALLPDEEPSESLNSRLQKPAVVNTQNEVALKHEEPSTGFNQIIIERSGELTERQTGQAQYHSQINTETAPQLALLIREPAKELTGTVMKPVCYVSGLNISHDRVAMEIAEHEDKALTDRWSAMIVIAPNYSYRSLSSGSSGTFNREHFNNYESGLFSLSGSINLVYRINQRLSFQSGLDLVRMGQKINNVQIFNDPQVIDKLNRTGLTKYYQTTPSVSNSFGSIQTSTSSMYFTDNHNRELNRVVNPQSYFEIGSSDYQQDSDIEIKQGLYYLQTPVMLRYSVLRGNTGLVVSGGLGVNFLVGNNVLLKYEGENLNIGYTRDINRFGLSGIVAIGLERRINRKIKVLIEPRFNHFISRVNSNGSMLSLPYSFSVSGGVTYGF